jgi:hypothetical protein
MSAGVIGFIIGALLGVLTTSLIAVNGRAERCDECRRRREPKEGGGYHIGSHKELF